MTKLIWFLVKAFVAVTMVAVFSKWILGFLGITTVAQVQALGPTEIVAILCCGIVSFFIGFASGGIVAEESVLRRARMQDRTERRLYW